MAGPFPCWRPDKELRFEGKLGLVTQGLGKGSIDKEDTEIG